MSNERKKSLQKIGIFIALIVGVNVLLSFLPNRFKWDATTDKRFTLTQPTIELVKKLDDAVMIECYLDGEFPAGFRRLQTATRDLFNDLRGYNSNIQFQFINTREGGAEEQKKWAETLAKDGISPVNLQLKGSDKYEEQIIYPAAKVYYKTKYVVVNLLENQVAGANQEEILNNSVTLLEYKFSNAISKLKNQRMVVVGFTEGHGELSPQETADWEKEMRESYTTVRINLDSVVSISTKFNVLVVARPRTAFDEKQKFKLDQYIMNGGKVIWLIDRLAVATDSLMLNKEFSPYDYPINLEDQLYRYGARINPNIVLDMRCGGLKVKVGMLGNQPQFDTRPWIYYPIAPGRETHPIVKNLGAVWFRFPGSIDTIKTKTPVKKTVLLTSSPTTRMQAVPTILSLNNIRELSNPMFFNKAPQPLAVLLEGQFPSLYENRVSPEMQATLSQLGQPFRNSSVATKMLVVSDGDVARNQLTNKEGGYMPLGFSRDDGQFYANRDFLLNAVEYMLDEDGVIAARNKEVKLRMLDRVRAKQEKTKWQLVNTLLPLLVLGIFGVVFTFLRRRKYAQ